MASFGREIFVLGLALVLTIPDCHAWVWTSSAQLSNGSTVAACPGQDVTLAWSFTPEAAEHVTNIEWHFTAPGGDERLIAAQVFGNFLPASSTKLSVQYLPNAGLRLINVAIGDTGDYSVHANMNLHGSVVTQVSTVRVHVSDLPITTDGSLHVRLLPDAVLDNATQEFHLQLACGRFQPQWQSRANVFVKTPSNATLSASSYAGGDFIVPLPNPVQTGEYTCVMDDNSPANLCLASDSPVQRGATLSVDGIQGQLIVMGSRMKAQRDSVDQRIAQLQAKQTQDLASLQRTIDNITQENNQLKQEVTSLKTKNIEIIANLSTLAKQDPVAFHVNIEEGITYDHNDVLKAGEVYTNIGGGYDNETGIFRAPVAGVYLFLASVSPKYGIGNGEYVRGDISLYGHMRAMCMSTYVDVQGATSTFSQGACHAVLRLEAGASVCLRNSDDHKTFSSNLSMFSGVLIQAE